MFLSLKWWEGVPTEQEHLLPWPAHLAAKPLGLGYLFIMTFSIPTLSISYISELKLGVVELVLSYGMPWELRCGHLGDEGAANILHNSALGDFDNLSKHGSQIIKLRVESNTSFQTMECDKQGVLRKIIVTIVPFGLNPWQVTQSVPRAALLLHQRLAARVLWKQWGAKGKFTKNLHV